MCGELGTTIYGYHVNDKSRCNQFLNDKRNLVVSEDTYWLGYGMYFWDNKGNAKYWLSIKKRQDSSKEYMAVKANILIDEDNILDLTDPDVVETVQNLWKYYCKLDKCDSNKPLGIKIDKLFKFFSEDWKQIYLVKGIGDYNITQEKHDFLRFNTSFSGPQVRGKVKTIYCARNSDIVINRKEVKIDEN